MNDLIFGGVESSTVLERVAKMMTCKAFDGISTNLL